MPIPIPLTPAQELVTLKAMLESSTRLHDWEHAAAIGERITFLCHQLHLDETREISEAKI